MTTCPACPSNPHDIEDHPVCRRCNRRRFMAHVSDGPGSYCLGCFEAIYTENRQGN